MSRSIALLAVLLFVASGCGHQQRGLDPALVDLLTTSGNLHFKVHLDEGAYAVASAVVEAEYVKRNCAGTKDLFGQIKPQHGGPYSIEFCQDTVDGNRGWFFGGGSWRRVRNCTLGDSLATLLGPDVTIRTSECLQFKDVRRVVDTSYGNPYYGYPWETTQLELVKLHDRWHVIYEDSVYDSLDGGATLWRRRTNAVAITSPPRFLVTTVCTPPLRKCKQVTS